MKKSIILVLVLATITLLTACSGNGIGVVMQTTPTPAAGTASAAPGESGALLPTPSPAAAQQTEINYTVSDAGFDELFKEAELVVLGTVMDDGEEWNSVRDVDDLSKPSTTIFMMDMSYTLKIDEVLKGDVKVNDSVKYNIAYRDKFKGESDYTMNENFLAPVKGSQYLLFLMRDPSFDDIYYVYTEPHAFELKNDTLFIYTKMDIKDSWGGGDGVTGVLYGSAKKEMGIS